ncbi:MAG: hypothetical protein V7776_21955 [Halopseudomonas aestusnigri]
MSLSFSAITNNQASSGSGAKSLNRERVFSTSVVSRRPIHNRAGSGRGVGGFSVGVTRGDTYGSPAEILYPTEKPFLSPYTSLEKSPVRRIRGLATLNLRKPEYNNTL